MEEADQLLDQETRGWVGHHPERVGGQDGGDHVLTELSILRSEQSLEIS